MSISDEDVVPGRSEGKNDGSRPVNGFKFLGIGEVTPETTVP